MDTSGSPILDYQSPPPGRRKRVPKPGEELCKLALLATTFFGYGVLGDPERKGYFFYSGLLLWVVIAGLLVGLRVREPPEYRRARGARRIVATLWLTSLAVFFLLPIPFSSTCPHGWKMHNGYVGIAHSINGGPCNVPQGRYGRHSWRVYGNWYVFLPPRY